MISQEYRNLLQTLRESRPQWGSTAYRYATEVADALEMTGAESILDFGAGTQSLRGCLPAEIEYTPYDPAIPGIDRLPADRSDLVVAIDVMEHVEEEYIDEVLQSIYDKARKGVFLLISTVKAQQILPDGRNSHISLFPAQWWRRKLTEFVWDDYHAQIEPNSLIFFARKQEETSVE